MPSLLFLLGHFTFSYLRLVDSSIFIDIQMLKPGGVMRRYPHLPLLQPSPAFFPMAASLGHPVALSMNCIAKGFSVANVGAATRVGGTDGAYRDRKQRFFAGHVVSS
ncbi:MAG: hypothetical protein ABI865_15625 [Nitrosospira sp.]